MANAVGRDVQITVGEGSVSGLLIAPKDARACYVLAHGAGAGMKHPFMAGVAQGLAERGIASLRYQFPYMERGSKRPDSAKAAQETVRAAVAKAASLLPTLPLFAGGKSYGGRMTSQAQAETPLEGIRGLAFLGFPLHAPGQSSATRAEHLAQVKIPMLFLQGTRDDLAHLDHLKPVIAGLGPRATLKLFENADHSFRVPAKSGRSNSEVMTELPDALANWAEKISR